MTINITPLGEYVFIKKFSDEQTTSSGIIHTLKRNKDHFIMGEAIAVGSEVKHVKEGTKVICQRIDAIPFKHPASPNDDYQFINYKYVYATYTQNEENADA